LLLAVAIGLRLAAALIGPALPLIVTLFVLVAIYGFLFKGR
jgi:hypothetical protein